ncbi:MAG TPA: MATE family efflux transporter [Candidatus Aphodoplasma excrementigallinarum]|uniref:Probable multidrug resistance protein NorM n=1 Tax=Candidatus Aphodoplasma excrementigallinarum TaxID=2840673 RepID=A0A9D1NH47_9FIRM|nr:MATE family efflux transporter [Candidatus Aphodoplasma excrementigallinarum]
MKLSIPSRVGPLTKIAMPCFVEQLLLVVVNVLSTMIVGQLGKAELSASSMSNQLVNWLQCAYVGLGSGATVVIGRMWGKGDREGAARGFMQSLKLTVLVSITVLILTVVFENAIVSLFFGGAEQAVIDNIHTYFFYCMIGMPATAIANVIGASLRGVGDNKTPLYTTAVLNVVNLVLSFLLIFGVPSLGIPRMGIAGAGIAISSARVVSAVFIIVYIFIKKKPILPGRYELGFHGETVRRVTRVGIPSAVEQIVFQGGFVILQSLLIGFGTVFQAGYQIGANLNNIICAPSMAMGVACTALISQTLGKRDWEGAKEYVKAANFIIYTVFIGISILMFLAAPVFSRMYSSDPEVIAEGTFFARMFALMALPIGVMQSMAGVLRGAGDAKYIAVTNVVGLWLMRVCLVWLLSIWTGNGHLAVVIGCGSDFLWRAISYALRVRKGNWLHIRV